MRRLRLIASLHIHILLQRVDNLVLVTGIIIIVVVAIAISIRLGRILSGT